MDEFLGASESRPFAVADAALVQAKAEVRPEGGVPLEILDEREWIRAAIKRLNRKLAA